MAVHKKDLMRSKTSRWVASIAVVAVLSGGTLAYAGARGNGDAPAVALATANGADVVISSDPSATAYESRSNSAASRSEAIGRPALSAATKTVTIISEGAEQSVTTQMWDVRGVLQQLNVVLTAEQAVAPGLDTPLVDGMTITIGAVTTSVNKVKETDKFSSSTVEDKSVPKGTRTVKQKGISGEVLTTYEVSVLNGKEIDRTVIASKVVSTTQDEIVVIGTGPKVVPNTPSSGGNGGGGNGGGGGNAQPVKTGSARAIAKEMAAARGWGDDQFACLDKLWQRESGWSYKAHNSSSGAHGIPQALPGSKMASAGADWATNPATQIKWGLGYIKGRYATPCGAWSSFQSKGWY